VSVQVWRNRATRDLPVVVSELQDDRMGQKPTRGAKPPSGGPAVSGMTLQDLTDAQRSQLKVETGVLVADVQGAAARAGIRRGDVITAVNNQDVKSVEHFRELMAQIEKGRIVALLVRRGGNSLYIPLRADGS
jgi:serine protease Do